MLWPILAMAGASLARTRAQVFGGGIFVLCVAAVFWSQHETSKVAVILAAVVIVIARLLPRMSIGLVAMAWLGASLLVVPVASEANKAGLHTDKRLPVSARARVILWSYTADLVTRNPWLGIGVGSTKHFDMLHAKTVSIPKGQVYAQRTGKHAHNVYLQTWFELGAIGAVFLAGLGLAVLRRIWMLPADVQPYALASFVTAAVTAGLSWGMWQTWYMAFFALGFMVMALAARITSVEDPAASHQAD
jgi:O-antigen ligase